MEKLIPLELDGTHGKQRVPDGAPVLLMFVKEDCPTCDITLPLAQELDEAWGGRGPRVLAVSQTSEGIPLIRQRHGLEFPVLDDSALDASSEYEVETVPHVLLADEQGTVLREFYGFSRDDWAGLVELVEQRWGVRAGVNWKVLPDMRPGCGSKTLEPGIAEKIAARRSGGLVSRRIDIGDQDDPFEFMFDQGLTDGLPVVPPTEERVARMLSGTRRSPQEVVAIVPPNMAPATVEKVAINAVMAGCKPEYLPVVIAAVEAACTDEFNLHGVLATTYFPTPIVIVNGPVRRRIGMNAGMNCMGQGNRANATISRALQLVVRNVGGGRPGEVDRCTIGQPGKYTFCFAENEERSPWEPLHVERGFKAEDSTVTLFAGEAPRAVMDQLSRGARGVATSIGMAIESIAHVKSHNYGEAILVISPEHADTIWRDRWTKDDIRARIQQVTSRPVRELLGNEDCPEGLQRAALGDNVTDEVLDRLVPKFREAKNLAIVVAGGEAGKFSAIIGGWVSGPMGSSMVTRKIEEA